MNLTYNINAELLADIVSVSKSTLLKWENNGKLKPVISTAGKKQYQINQLTEFREIRDMLNSKWDEEIQVKPPSSFLLVLED